MARAHAQTIARNELLTADKYVIKSTLDLFQIYGLDLDSRLSHYELVYLVKTKRLPARSPNQRTFSIREIISSQIKGYEHRTQRTFPEEILKEFGWTKADLKSQPSVRKILRRKGLPYKVQTPVDKDEWFDIFEEKRDISFKLKKKQQLSLAIRARHGDVDARNQLIRFCMPQIVRNCKIHSGSGLTLPELVSIGYQCLFQAVEAYDPNHKSDIRQYIFRYTSIGIRRQVEKEVKERKRISYAQQRRINPHTLAEKIPTTRFMGDNGGEEILEARKKKLKEFMFGVNKKRKEIIQRVINGESMETIGREMGLSRERIRQIKNEVLDFLRRGFRLYIEKFE